MGDATLGYRSPTREIRSHFAIRQVSIYEPGALLKAIRSSIISFRERWNWFPPAWSIHSSFILRPCLINHQPHLLEPGAGTKAKSFNFYLHYQW